MVSLVLRERLEIMVLREMLVPPAPLDLLVALDLRFVYICIPLKFRIYNYDCTSLWL